jgi:hypothetical protein
MKTEPDPRGDFPPPFQTFIFFYWKNLFKTHLDKGNNAACPEIIVSFT